MWPLIISAVAGVVGGAIKADAAGKATMPDGPVTFGGDAVTINGDGNSFTGSSTTPYINSGLDPNAFSRDAGRSSPASGQVAGVPIELLLFGGVALVVLMKRKK